MCGCLGFVFFQAEDGIRDLVRSRGLGDVYKRQGLCICKLNGETVDIDSFLLSCRILGKGIEDAFMNLSLIHI